MFPPPGKLDCWQAPGPLGPLGPLLLCVLWDRVESPVELEGLEPDGEDGALAGLGADAGLGEEAGEGLLAGEGLDGALAARAVLNPSKLGA